MRARVRWLPVFQIIIVLGLGVIAIAAAGACRRAAAERARVGDVKPFSMPDTPLPFDVGDEAPDFVLYDLEGKEVRLKDRERDLPVVLEFGSFT